MEILPDIAALSELEGGLDLAIGVFDGVHRGHAAVVASAVAGNGVPVVVTFNPHPIRVLCPDKAPLQLTRIPHKAKLLGSLGASYLLPVRFDEARAGVAAEDFVRELDASGNIASVSVGAGFRFGKGRAGDVDLLAKLGAELGFETKGIEPICDEGGAVISSTCVRAALAAGDLDTAAGLLGRPFSIFATVERGRQLGRTIGFPTANLMEVPELLPPNGVYAIRAEIGGERRSGVGNLGLRPTVDGKRKSPLFEAHFFDFDDEIYGQKIEVELLSFVRSEQKFKGIEALKAQITADVERVRAAL